MTHLNLRNNQIAALPESMGNVRKLRFLDLRNNRLTQLPESMRYLPNLRGWICAGINLPRRQHG
ncbi:MAG: hypothetical protein R2911_20465 [Caldilineaceae bacterium]